MVLLFSSFQANKLLEFTKLYGLWWPSPIPLSQIISCTNHKTSESNKKREAGRQTASNIDHLPVFPLAGKEGTWASEELLCVVLKTHKLSSSSKGVDVRENASGEGLLVGAFRLEWQHCDWLGTLHQNPAEHFISWCITPHVSVCLCPVPVRMQTSSAVLMFSCFVECLSSLFKAGKLRSHRIKSFHCRFAIKIQFVPLPALLVGSHLVCFVPVKAN